MSERPDKRPPPTLRAIVSPRFEVDSRIERFSREALTHAKVIALVWLDDEGVWHTSWAIADDVDWPSEAVLRGALDILHDDMSADFKNGS